MASSMLSAATATQLAVAEVSPAAEEESECVVTSSTDNCKDADAINSSLRYCANDPEFAVICAFLQKFAKDLGVDLPNFKHLQEWLTNSDEVAPQLRDLHIKLLRKTRKTVHEKSWEGALSKFCFSYSAQDAWEVERFGYKKSSLKVKLRIFRELLESQFERNAKFRAKILALSANSLRSEPIGRDRLGHSYWLTQDNDCNLRIYQEHLDEEIWQVVATNREELVNLITRLRGNEVVLPSNDIGVVDEDTSSSNSCAAPVIKPPPPEEQDDSQEEETARIPNIRIKIGNGINKIDVDSTTKPKDEAVPKPDNENKPHKVNKITLKNNTPPVEESEEDADDDNDTGNENEDVFAEDDEEQIRQRQQRIPKIYLKPSSLKVKHEETVKKVKPLLISQSKIINSPKPVTTSKKRPIDDLEPPPKAEEQTVKKLRPLLLDSKRIKKPSKYEKIKSENDESDEDDEEEGEGEEDQDDYDDDDDDDDDDDCDDECDEDDIDSAAAEEDENEEKYIDDDDDEDNDDDGEDCVGDEIEDPPLIVRGEGNGRDCKDKNTLNSFFWNFEETENNNDETAYSDIIEDPIFYVVGYGSGKTSLVGNNKIDNIKSDGEKIKEIPSQISNDEPKATFFFGEPGCLKLSPIKQIPKSASSKESKDEKTENKEFKEINIEKENESILGEKGDSNNIVDNTQTNKVLDAVPLEDNKVIINNEEKLNVDETKNIHEQEEDKILLKEIDNKQEIEMKSEIIVEAENIKANGENNIEEIEQLTDIEEKIEQEVKKEEFNDLIEKKENIDEDITVKEETVTCDKNEVEAQTDLLKEANTSSEVSNEVFKDEEVGKSATLLAEEAVHDNNVVNSSENFQTKNEMKIDKEIKSEEVVNEIKSETVDCEEEISENNIEADLNKDILIPNNEPTQVPNNELAEQPNMNNNEFLTKPVEEKVDETIDDSVKKLDAVSEQIVVSEESILPKSNNESAILSPKTVELIKPSTTKENTNKSPENPEQPKIDEIKTNDTDNSLTSPPLNSLSTKTLNQATLPNRKRRLAEFISTRNTRQSISECELEANTENQTEEDFVDDSNDLDVGGKRLKMRPKCLNTELRKIIEAKKVATEETTSSSGEEDSRKNRKIIAPKARLDKTKSPKSPPVNDRNETKTILDQTDTNKVEETSSNIAQVKAEDSVTTVSTVPNPVPPVAVNKQKPTLAEIIEKKLKKAPEVPKITNTETSPLSLEKTSNTFNSPRKSPITKPLKKNLLTQLRQEESDEEAIPRKRTISETVASPVLTESIKLPENASIQVKQEIEEKEKETIVHQKSLDRKTPERQRKRRSSEEIKQNNIPETVKDKLILTENVKIEDVSKEDDEKIEQPKKQKNLEEDKSNISESKKELKKKVTPSPPEPVANRRSSRRGGAAVVYTELSLPKRTRGANLIIKKEDIKNESKDDKVVVEKAVPKTENNSDSNKKTVKKLGAKTNKKDDPILVKKELEMVRSLEMKAAAEQQAGLTQSPAEDNKSSSSRGVRKKREVVDTTNIIESTDAETPVRQSRRIAQQKIKEEAERRKLEEIALRTMKQELKKKKKAEKQADSTVAEPSEQSSSEDECLVELKKKSKKKCPGKDGWSSGSEEQEEPEEEDEEPPHYESDPGSPLFKSDHEFSPESDIEDESQVVPMKRARTARKEDAEDGDIRDEEACQKCGKSDHPEWILLCDNCDKGYHCSCLSPVLFYIPEGDWYCPPCQQEQLIVALEMQLKQFDELVERKKWEEEEEKRLAQEAERAEQERLELEKTRKKSKRSKYHDGESCSSEEANDNEKSDGDRESDEDTKSQGRDNIHKKVKNDNIDTVKRRRGDGRRRRRAAARGARRTRRQRHGSDSATDSDSLSDSASDNESSSDSFSDSDNEPIYKLRKRRQINVSYRLNEFDDLINSALKKEMDEVAGAGNLGRGKDITTILEADKEEKARLKQLEKSNQQVSDRETSEMKEEKKSDEEESLKRKARPKLSLKKKSRKLTTLDISSEEDNASDEDFKTSSFDDEEEEDTSVSVSSNSDSSLEMYKRRNKHSKKKQRKAARRAARERRKVRNFVVEDSDDDEEENRPKSKKKRKDDSDYTESETGDDLSELTENLDSADLCDDTTSEDSDGAWHPSKRKKQRRNTTAIARKSPKLKKQPVKIKKRVEYSDDDITESEEEDEDDDDDVCGGKGSGKQPRSQPLKTNNSNKESNKGKGKGKGKGTTSKKKKKHPSDDESLSDSGDSTRRTRGRRYAYLEDFDDDSSDGGIKPGVKRPDTPPEEREKFIQKQEEIKRMLAEKNAEGAKLAATPRLTPIKAGEEKGKRSPAKPGDSLSTVPLSVIRQAKVLDIDYLQRKGENIGDNDNVAEVEPTFDDVDLPDDLPDDMDEEEIARMVDEEEDFDNATVRELPSAEEVLRTPTKSKSKDTEKLLANPSLAAMSQMPSATSSGLQEPLRKRLPMPTMHPPLLRHQTSHQDLPMGQILQRHPAPSSYLLQNALNTPLGQPLNRSFTQQQFQQIHQHQMQQQQLHQQQMQQQQLQHQQQLQQQRHRQQHQDQQMQHRILHAQFQQIQHQQFKQHLQQQQQMKQQHESAHHMPPIPPGHSSAPSHMMPARPPLPSTQQLSGVTPTTEINTGTATTTTTGTATGTTTGTATGTTTGTTTTAATTVTVTVTATGTASETTAGTTAGATPGTTPGATTATATGTNEIRPRGRRKKITPLRDPIQKQQAAAAVSAANAAALAAKVAKAKEKALEAASQSKDTKPDIHSGASAQQHYKPPGPVIESQSSVITRMPHIPPIPPGRAAAATAGFYSNVDVARFYGPPQQGIPGERQVNSPQRIRPPPTIPGMPPQQGMRPTYGPPLRGGNVQPNHSSASTAAAAAAAAAASGVRLQYTPSQSERHGTPMNIYGTPPPARHASSHLNPYRASIYGNPNFNPRAANIRSGAPAGPEYTGGPRGYPPFGYYPNPPPLTTAPPQTSAPPSTAPHAVSATSSVIVTAPPAASTASTVSVVPPPVPASNSTTLSEKSPITVTTNNKPTPEIVTKPITTLKREASPEPRKKLITLEAYSKESAKSPLAIGGESSGSRSSPGLQPDGAEDSSSAPAAINAPANADANNEGQESEFSGLVSYFSSQHDDYNT